VKHVWVVLAAPVLAGVVVFAVTVWKPWEASASPPTRTDVRFFDPSSAITSSGTRVVGHAVGACLSYSLTDPAPFVFRCFGDRPRGVIYPTCFGGDDYATRVLCVVEPWVPDAVAFRVKEYDYDVGSIRTRTFRTGQWIPGSGGPRPKELPYPYIVDQRHRDFVNTEPPWALELANGERCLAVAGATDVIVGFRANYGCTPSTSDAADQSGGWVIGGPDRRRDLWVVEYLPPGSSATTQVAVDAAWY